MKPIYSITSAVVKPRKGATLLWHVMARGLVSSTGWTKPQLLPRFYVTPPADGLLEFDFVAQPPDGIAATVLRPVAAQTSLPPPEWACGVKIHASTNTAVACPAFPATKALMSVQPVAACNAAQPVKVALAMQLDADVSFYDTLVTLEGEPVLGWQWQSEKNAYMRAYPALSVTGPLDVYASARSRTDASVSDALVLAVVIEGHAPQTLRVNTQNFKGRATAAYHV